MGGKSPLLHELARTIWLWCLDRKLWLTVNHVPGAKNIVADELSRKLSMDTEWSLNPDIFKEICTIFGNPTNKLPKYVAFVPDPSACAIDAFNMKFDSNILYYSFPSFSCIGRLLQKIEIDRAEMILVALMWNTQHWFTKMLKLLVTDQIILPPAQMILSFPLGTRENSPVKETETLCMQTIRQLLRQRGIPQESSEIIISSWRSSTKQQYWVYFEKWMCFCERRKIDYFQPSVNNILEFLTDLFKQGLGYSSINTAKSCLAVFLQLANEQSHLAVNSSLVKRFMKGIFQMKPALPKYSNVWNVSVVLEYLETLMPLHTISLRLLSHKLVTLLALLSGQRCQTLHLIDVRNVKFDDLGVKIFFGDVLKQTRPGYHLRPLEFKFFTDESLCVVKTLQAYIGRTKEFRKNETQLFISTIAPFHRICKQTVANWIRTVLCKSGIDVKQFSPQSTRSAAVSAAKQCNVPINIILNSAGWGSDCVFRKFYDKDILAQDSCSMGDLLLKKYGI
jgi:hypothetical protein